MSTTLNNSHLTRRPSVIGEPTSNADTPSYYGVGGRRNWLSPGEAASMLASSMWMHINPNFSLVHWLVRLRGLTAALRTCRPEFPVHAVHHIIQIPAPFAQSASSCSPSLSIETLSATLSATPIDDTTSATLSDFEVCLLRRRTASMLCAFPPLALTVSRANMAIWKPRWQTF